MGINDIDLEYCLIYNKQAGFDFDDVAVILAVYEGERDGEHWRWVI